MKYHMSISSYKIDNIYIYNNDENMQEPVCTKYILKEYII